MLILGLICGIAFPQIAGTVRMFLPEMVATLLLLNALKIGWRETVGSIRHGRTALLWVCILQILMGSIVGGVFYALDLMHSPYVLSVLLVLSAPAVTAAPNLAELLGFSPAPALRLLIIGTAAVPFTILPMLWLLPNFSDVEVVMLAAGKLCAIIILASGVGFLLQYFWRENFSTTERFCLNSVIHPLLMVIVIGLMPSFQPTLLNEPLTLLFWLLTACALNFGIQILTLLMVNFFPDRDTAVAFSVIAGNRNIALFLIVLPASVVDPILLFIACYQLPMYTTPVLMKKLYHWAVPPTRD